MLRAAEVQNSQKNTGSWTAREKTKFEQVSLSLLLSLSSYELWDIWCTWAIYILSCRYIPNATGAIYEILKEMSRSHASKKKRLSDKDEELLKQVSAKIVTEETLREKLAQHVEQVRSFCSCWWPFHELHYYVWVTHLSELCSNTLILNKEFTIQL